MTVSLILDENTLRNFVGPATKPGLLAALSSAQTNKRYLMLAAIQRQLQNETPQLAVKTGFHQAYQTLKQLSQKALVDLIAYPSFGKWCRTAGNLLARQMHVTLPAGQVESHLGLLANFAVAGAITSGLAVEMDIWLNDQAALPLPTLQCAICAPLEFAGQRVHCKTEPNYQLVLAHRDLPSQRLHVGAPPNLHHSGEGLFRIKQAPRLAERFELNDFDPLLKYVTAYQQPHQFEVIDPAGQERWMTSLRSSWKLLQRVHSAYAAQIEQGISVIVPLRSPSMDTHVSGSFPDTLGMIQMSWSDHSAKVAEVLVHEYHHNKLNTLLDLDPLVADDSGAEAYYSPWKEAPRPLSGLLHAIFAFQSVVHFFRAYLDAELRESADHTWAEHEYGRRLAQVLTGIDALIAQSELTPAGKVVIQQIQSQLQSLPEPDLPAAAMQRMHTDLAAHRLRWQLAYQQTEPKNISLLERMWQNAGGTFRTVIVQVEPEKLEFSGPGQSEIGQQLGAADGIPVNRISAAQVRKDPTLDNLSVMSVRSPSRFTELAERIKQTISVTTPAMCVLAGHVAYIGGEWSTAANYYAGGLDAAPDNVDTWRDFAFALRHLGLSGEANVFLFQPRLVIAIAQQVILDEAALANLLSNNPDLPNGIALSESARKYTLFLRWLGEAA